MESGQKADSYAWWLKHVWKVAEKHSNRENVVQFGIFLALKKPTTPSFPSIISLSSLTHQSIEYRNTSMDTASIQSKGGVVLKDRKAWPGDLGLAARSLTNEGEWLSWKCKPRQRGSLPSAGTFMGEERAGTVALLWLDFKNPVHNGHICNGVCACVRVLYMCMTDQSGLLPFLKVDYGQMDRRRAPFCLALAINMPSRVCCVFNLCV